MMIGGFERFREDGQWGARGGGALAAGRGQARAVVVVTAPGASRSIHTRDAPPQMAGPGGGRGGLVPTRALP